MEILDYETEFQKLKKKFEGLKKYDEFFFEILKSDIKDNLKDYIILLQDQLKKNAFEDNLLIYDFFNSNKLKMIKLIEIKLTKIILLFGKNIKELQMDDFLILISYFYLLIEFMRNKITKEDEFKHSNIIKINIDSLIIEYNEILIRYLIGKIRNELTNDSLKRIEIDYPKYLIKLIVFP